MPTNFAAGLNQDTRSQIVDLLNANLVNTINLTLAVKQAHWNLKGKGFIGVHELLDDPLDDVPDVGDPGPRHGRPAPAGAGAAGRRGGRGLVGGAARPARSGRSPRGWASR